MNQKNQISSVQWSDCRMVGCTRPFVRGSGQCKRCGFVVCNDHLNKATVHNTQKMCPGCFVGVMETAT